MRLPLALAALLAALPAAARADDPPVPAPAQAAAPAAAAGAQVAVPPAAPAAAPVPTAAAATAAPDGSGPTAPVPAAAAPAVAVPAVAAPQMAVPTTTFPPLGIPAVSVPTLSVLPAPPPPPTANQLDAAEARDAQAAGLPLPPDTAAPAAVAAGPALASRGGNAVLPRWGLAVGGGFPDFGMASVLYRPASHLRLSAGPSWHYVGWGVHGGVTLVPWNAWLTPVLSLSGGRFFRTDVASAIKSTSEDLEDLKPLLRDMSYWYGALDVGLELGSPRGFALALRFGLSFVSLRANGTATYTSDDGAAVTLRDPRLRATMPSAKLAFQYWF
jgi:hypothetical protein